ncbi:MAG: hypothetical protein LUB60_00975, partial [Clostridiales bacterium]|nr:hypothetical protein [Clostridiales bacterium]
PKKKLLTASPTTPPFPIFDTKTTTQKASSANSSTSIFHEKEAAAAFFFLVFDFLFFPEVFLRTDDFPDVAI